ncbi:MAG: threonine-phosphate decarboxylase CobD [Alphaproteobacteria bacterium]
MFSNSVVHGGNIDWAERVFGRPPNGWLDLSTGINPYPYPVHDLPFAAWTHLPDDGADRALREAAAAYYGTGDPARVVTAPGSQALIQWLPRITPPSQVAVVSPTYCEHARSWASAGHSVDTIADIGGASLEFDVIIVTNPNNPDGRVYSVQRLMEIAGRLSQHGGLLIVDEAFADLDPANTVGPNAGTPSLLVLRSFGKFFGLAGLRLGFGLAEPGLINRLREALGPWAVSGPALQVATRALRDPSWIDATRARLASGAVRLDSLLTEAGLEVVGGTALFRLVADADAQDVFAYLARCGILVRHFPDRPEWLRIGQPAGDTDYARLAEALAVRPAKQGQH